MRRWLFVIVTLLTAALAVSSAATATAATGRPHLRLFAASDSIVLNRYGTEPVRLDVGAYLSATGADFELLATRSYGRPIEVSQVVGHSQRALPDGVADGWNGLTGFFQFTVLNSSGGLVAKRLVTFCPDQWNRQRVSDNGPLTPRFPTFCASNPFSRGMVWGIDHGWADSLGDSAPEVRLAPGQYQVAVRIPAAYADMFGIAPADAVARVAVTVRKASDGGCPPFCLRRRAATGDGAQPASVPTITNPDPATLPDLEAVPAWSIGIEHFNGRDRVGFAATVWDAGPAPMVVEGFRRANTNVMDAYEYFFRDGVAIGRAPAGTMVYDARPGHEHWHFEQFARYTLLTADHSRVVRSRKEAFCLAPTDALDLTVPNAEWNPYSVGLFGACGDAGSIWTRETLPVGWGDTYFQSLPGQSFDITTVPNGTYYVEVQANPLGLLKEADSTNNVRMREIILGGTPGHRTVTVPAWRGIDA
jgi:hypothetical protein